jgi:choline dehydrogenase-like flavoprotein
METAGHVYDWIVSGSGFGGSVSALRLAEKGYRVLVIEKGRRFATTEFAKTNMDLSLWLWAPAAGPRCPTLADAMRSFARYVGLLNEALELVDDGDRVIWRQRARYGDRRPRFRAARQPCSTCAPSTRAHAQAEAPAPWWPNECGNTSLRKKLDA